MSYFFLIATLLASIYAFTFARWLRNGGNSTGAWGMYAMVICAIAVALYRIVMR